MKLSLEWLREYVSIPAEYPVKRIAHDLTMSTVEVESVTELHRDLDGVVVGTIRDLRDAPPGRSLRVATCDVGSRQVTIVSDAENLVAGQRVAVALPGAAIRFRGGDSTGAVAAREVGGLRSEGVICTAAHLGIAGLFPVRTPAEAIDLGEADVAPGEPLAAAIDWNDTVLEIDNKSLTHRPDLWGHFGIARELSAIYRVPLRPLPQAPKLGAPEPLVVPGFDTSLCRRFFAARIALSPNGHSPLWLRSRLLRVGQQPRNLLVDLTNYVMFAVGQPAHAYDAAKVRLPLCVRHAQEGERLRLLDGREYVLKSSMPVIADTDRSVGAAGVMGGDNSAVDDDTQEVILEMGNFDALAVRRMATSLGVRTEASSRFEKSLDTMRIDDGRAVFFDTLKRIRPAARVMGFADEHPRPTQPVQVEVGVDFLVKRLGVPMEREQIAQRLTSVGFAVEGDDTTLRVRVPSWRATGDVSLPHDVLEEVARLHGYENFRYVEPRIGLRQIARSARQPVEQELRSLLARVGGLQEVVSYPWASDNLLQAVGMAGAVHLALALPPAPDKRSLRPSLVPGIVERVVENLRYSAVFGLFEIGRVFPSANMKPLDDAREKLPNQPLHAAGAIAGIGIEEVYVAAKGVVEDVAAALRLPPLRFEATADLPWADAKASVAIWCEDQRVGSTGILSSRTRRLAGIKRGAVAVFELFVESLPSSRVVVRHQPLPQFPGVSIDISMIFPQSTAWRDIERALAGLHPRIRSVAFIDQFRGRGIPPDYKSITLRLRLGADDRTLRSEETAQIAALAFSEMHARFAARLRQADSEGPPPET